MTETVARAIANHRMFREGARIGVAVSGGTDSVCLLHVLHELAPRWGLSLAVLHLNHMLRGEASDKDEQFVRELAGSLELPFLGERIDIAALALAAGANLEEAARDARRDFFAREIQSGRVARVALAHTRNDQAETVLFRFLRGAYLTGLGGMRPVTQEGFVRPFLDLDRSDIERYMTERGIAWREDASNTDLRFSRNRIRQDLLPALTAAWNPALPSLLANHALLAQEDDSYWERQVDCLAPQLFTEARQSVVAPVSAIAALHPALQRRVLRRAIQLVRGDLHRIDFSHIGRAMELIQRPEGHARVQVPGVDIMRSFSWVRFAKLATGGVERHYEVTVEVPADVFLPWAGSTVSLELADIGGEGLQSAHDTLRLDVASALVLRNWRPGDAYHPIFRPHGDKIKTLFHEARIPLWERRHWPVLTAGGTIVWSRGFGAARDAAAGPASTKVLRIREKKHPS